MKRKIEFESGDIDGNDYAVCVIILGISDDDMPRIPVVNEYVRFKGFGGTVNKVIWDLDDHFVSIIVTNDFPVKNHAKYETYAKVV
jgi:hypothetical protein